MRSPSSPAVRVPRADPELRRARAAGVAFFLVLGFGGGSWLVSLPVIERHVGVDHTLLGFILLCSGLGAVVGMQITGPLVDRFGPRRMLRITAVCYAATLLGPALARQPWQLFAAALVLGIGTGALDVSVNAHGVAVERRYGRPILASFHATFSLGGVLVAALGGRVLRTGWPPAAFLPAVAAVLVVASLAAGPFLLRPRPAVLGTGGADDEGPGSGPVRPARSAVLLLCALAALLMISEGVAYDWSALHLADVLGAPTDVAAWAYGAFSVSMTAGRFLADRVATRVGSVRVIRYGALIGAAGLVLAAASISVPLSIAGWAVFGIGLCGTIPQIFTAAGNLDAGASGKGLSQVVGAGYVGVLAGPGLIGIATHFVPLNVALLMPVAFCVLAACGAGAVRRRAAVQEPVRTMER